MKLKLFNKIKIKVKPKEPCPKCGKLISVNAIRCKWCRYWILKTKLN